MRLAPALLLCVASAAHARRVTAEQLAARLAPAQRTGKTDVQLAHSLADIELTERLTEATRTRLLALAPDPRTRDVIRILADVSAFLEVPQPNVPPRRSRPRNRRRS